MHQMADFMDHTPIFRCIFHHARVPYSKKAEAAQCFALLPVTPDGAAGLNNRNPTIAHAVSVPCAKAALIIYVQAARLHSQALSRLRDELTQTTSDPAPVSDAPKPEPSLSLFIDRGIVGHADA